MKESITYQMILREGEARGEAIGEARGEARGQAIGEAREARKFILLFGRKKFGVPSREEQATLEGVTEVERLEELALKIESAHSWQQLLGLAAPRRRSGRRKSSP